MKSLNSKLKVFFLTVAVSTFTSSVAMAEMKVENMSEKKMMDSGIKHEHMEKGTMMKSDMKAEKMDDMNSKPMKKKKGMMMEQTSKDKM
ncbi:hypothetical protein [Caviibacterium pharyngocola]|uniref:Pentapeptide MXKDX repeat protein n=1 Tax=Caviibacterium pharyngocola TaxID=28159 RepID=A0A2M8RYW4_9PAST|nr:hypothetical protein [Caviibacterium pharyngocola]PJG84079.1 hypothetical protein CVP04_01100 [Caviibacterium pharyngocola]